jgi:hypothetical protein
MEENKPGEPARGTGNTSSGSPQAKRGMISRASAHVAPTRIADFVDKQGERVADLAWRGLKRVPYVGVALAVGAALGAASVVGVAELALAVGAGYAAYQVLRLNVPPSKAIRKAVAVEEKFPV